MVIASLKDISFRVTYASLARFHLSGPHNAPEGTNRSSLSLLVQQELLASSKYNSKILFSNANFFFSYSLSLCTPRFWSASREI
jgi:hypothetical protein